MHGTYTFQSIKMRADPLLSLVLRHPCLIGYPVTFVMIIGIRAGMIPTCSTSGHMPPPPICSMTTRNQSVADVLLIMRHGRLGTMFQAHTLRDRLRNLHLAMIC